MRAQWPTIFILLSFVRLLHVTAPKRRPLASGTSTGPPSISDTFDRGRIERVAYEPGRSNARTPPRTVTSHIPTSAYTCAHRFDRRCGVGPAPAAHQVRRSHRSSSRRRAGPSPTSHVRCLLGNGYLQPCSSLSVYAPCSLFDDICTHRLQVSLVAFRET